MHWKEDKSVAFVNPYNFISIKNQSCERKKFQKGSLTGVIKCTLIPKTHVIIPNSSNNNALNEVVMKDGKNIARSYNFFSYDDLSKENKDPKGYYEPVIPGSEIRGVIRSAYEAATNSCLSAIDFDRVLHQRSSKVKQKAGILTKKDDNWMIQEADIYMVKSKECNNDPMKKINRWDYDEGETVYIKLSATPYKNRNHMPKTVTRIEKKYFNGSIKGYIHLGEDIWRKHHERVFVPKNIPLLPVGEKAINNFRKLLELYSDEKLNKNINAPPRNVQKHTGYKNVEVKEGALVYYDSNNDISYLSPAPITREVFNSKMEDILGDFIPCERKKMPEEKKDFICDGCRLFGMISADKEGVSLASRIRFSDAKVLKKSDNRKYYIEDRIINELSSPKISSTEFYMESPYRIDCDIWNYDYAIKWTANAPRLIQIPKVYIRGRKFYWHHKPRLEDRQPKLNERNNKIRILDSDNEFKFDVYFENISKEELEKLVWTLTIGGRKDNYHKIGMGKPLGFGSFKINVDKIIKRELEIKDETIKYDTSKLDIGFDDAEKNGYIKVKSKNVQEFLIITDFNSTNDARVCYPIGDDGSRGENAMAGYQWFIGNRFNDVAGGAMKPKIKKPLPEIKRPAGVLYKFNKYR